jgi:hypothetical protein
MSTKNPSLKELLLVIFISTIVLSPFAGLTFVLVAWGLWILGAK